MKNFYRINGLVIVCLLVMLSLLFMQNKERIETYIVASNEVISQKNTTDDIWNRHPIEDSMPLDYVVKYQNAYYNELDNTSFMKGLVKAFKPNPLLVNGYEWIRPIEVDKQHIPPQALIDQYKTILDWIEKQINHSANENFTIPGDKPAPFQIIHDHWNSWSKNIIIPNRFLYSIDVVIYRESKYHAKHLRFFIVTDSKGIVGVSEIRIEGIIFEDRFGLFPVVFSDTTDLNVSKTMPYDSNELASYQPLLQNETIANELERRREQNVHNEKIIKILDRSSIE